MACKDDNEILQKLIASPTQYIEYKLKSQDIKDLDCLAGGRGIIRDSQCKCKH